MKFLNLNLYKGKCLPEVLAFLEKEAFDIIHMQEVSGGRVSFGSVDCFQEICRRTGLRGELMVAWHRPNDPQSYFGNATFYSPAVTLQERLDLRYRPLGQIDDIVTLPPHLHPKGALFLRFSHGDKQLWSINTHMSWGPTPYDEPYKVENARILAQKLQTLDLPFILSGDFNVIADTDVIRLIEAHGRNLPREKGITNTLNAAIHRAQHLFPQGLAVDFIFTHPDLESRNLQLLDQYCLSDHIGLSLEF